MLVRYSAVLLQDRFMVGPGCSQVFWAVFSPVYV